MNVGNTSGQTSEHLNQGTPEWRRTSVHVQEDPAEQQTPVQEDSAEQRNAADRSPQGDS